MSFQYIEEALRNDTKLNGDCSMLLIGPGNSTTELRLKAIKEASADRIIHFDNKTCFKNCNDCPFRCICKKGKEIENGRLPYEQCTFDKVMLLASSGLGKGRNTMKRTIEVLKFKGQLFLLINKSNSTISNRRSGSFLFDMEDTWAFINSFPLEIESVSTIGVFNSSTDVMCLIATRTKDQIQ
ncbi:MAG: hypothetical protein PVF73_02180 [Bacteroidales bacterium]